MRLFLRYFLVSLVAFAFTHSASATEIAWNITLTDDFSTYENKTVALVYTSDKNALPILTQKEEGGWGISIENGQVWGVANFNADSATDFTSNSSTVSINVALVAPPWGDEYPAESGWTDPFVGYDGIVEVANAERWDGMPAEVIGPSEPTRAAIGGGDTMNLFLLVFDASEIANASSVVIHSAADAGNSITYDASAGIFNEVLSVNFTLPSSVPEPGAVVLLGFGAAVCALRRRVR